MTNLPVSGTENPLDYVDPLIGTSNTGNTYPAVCTPFGMTKWTPQTNAGERKGIPPYIFEDTTIQGFRGTHFFSGSAVPEYGSVGIMPLIGELKIDPVARGSKFTHYNEKTTPYYYAVTLDDYHTKTEVTATTHVGYFKFIFPESNSAYILVQPNNNPYADHTKNSVAYVRIIPEKNEVAGFNPCFRFYAGTGKPAGFMGYFVARFSKPFSTYGVWRSDEIKFGSLEAFGQPGAFLKFTDP
ncbi:MAG: glycoside hydrolase family 92 protein, partial [Patescibacteria group bacterium]|nr:glycoside hydrolase family 92 protein [Patescibacteria group bacterium]